MQSPDLCCLSPSLNRPLQCATAPTALLRNYRHNPWIGGPGVLSPRTSSLIANDDSNPPGLSPCDGIDSASDSGIDDVSVAENMSPLKRSFNQQKYQTTNVFGMKAAAAANVKKTSYAGGSNPEYHDKLLCNDMNDTEGTRLAINNSKLKVESMQAVQLAGNLDEDDDADDEDDVGASVSKRKRSLSYLDSSNPLMTPFLMDLCNDDYHMNSKEYLQENDIENVLSEWPADLV